MDSYVNHPVKGKLAVRRLAFSAMAIALATVASMIPMPKMPMGGHITCFSLLFIALIGYWYGIGGGIACGIAFGLLQLIIDPYILSIPQVLCDYVFAFGSLGLAGVFSMKKNVTPLPGYLLGVAGRYLFAVISGVVFFGMYAPTSGVLSNPLLYALVYNFIYIGAEAVLTVIILQIKPVKQAIDRVGKIAVGAE